MSREFAAAFDAMRDAERSQAQMDERIGELVRNGRTIYYAFLDGRYVERYSVADMMDVMTARGFA